MPSGKNKRTIVIIPLAITAFVIPVIQWLLFWHLPRPLYYLDVRWLTDAVWAMTWSLGGCGLLLARGWQPDAKLLKTIILIILWAAIALGPALFLWLILVGLAVSHAT